MKCPKCQFENLQRAKFCIECGAELELICPKCNSIITSATKICDVCGQDESKSRSVSSVDFMDPHSYTPKHLAEKILTLRSSIEGERKMVTVLFADVANLTSIAEKLDPEEVHKIMDGCFEILMEEIHKHEGTVNQFTGDGVMALFGAPLAHEDHAQRACLSALSIQEALTRYSWDLKAKYAINFKMRLGVNSGPVVVGSIGDNLRMDYTAIGDTTNLAARMEGMAEPGSILISGNTQKIIRQYFNCRSLGQFAVKGREEPLEVYQLMGGREVYRPRLGMEREIYTDMLGRDRELAFLELQVMKVINGQGSIVNIIGEAGVGKSRLVTELKKREVMKKVVYLEGRAISIGRNLSFHPVIDLLKQWAGIKLEDSDTICHEKLRFSVKQVCRDETDEVFPFVATLMGIKLSGQDAGRVHGIEGGALQKLILKSMRTLLIRATEQAPLVIVIEDLHWTDISTIELLESLFPLAEKQRIVVINMFRPGYHKTGDRIAESVKAKCAAYSSEIMLQPLSKQLTKLLIDDMVKNAAIHHRIQHEIIERAGGNPFFIEEVVRSLIDHDALVFRNGKFEATDVIDTVVIPQTISDVIMARIDRLEDNTRELIKIASVIGRSFFYRIISEVAKMIRDVDRRLDYLKQIQFIEARTRLEELEYLFKHALVQQTAYESILHQKRKKLHLTVADSIEKLFARKLSEFYGMLAYHYSKADELDKAEKYMIKAGEEALKSSASIEALYYYQNAMEFYIQKLGRAVDPNKMAELEENIGFAFFNRGYYKEAIHYFTRALAGLGIKEPKNNIHLIIKIVFSLFVLIKNLYIPALRKKKAPSRFDNRIMRIILHRGKSLSIIDARRFFINCVISVPFVFKKDISKSQLYFDALCGMSGLFSYTGISFAISQRLLDYAHKSVQDKAISVSLHYYRLLETIHACLVGNWRNDFDTHSVDYAVKIGDLNAASLHLVYLDIMHSESGNFDICERLIDKIKNIVDNFDHEYAEFCFFRMHTRHLIQKREFINVLKFTHDAIELGEKIGVEMQALTVIGKQLKAQVMLLELDAARETIEIGEKVLRDVKRVPPIYLSSFLTGKFLYDLAVLEKVIVQDEMQNRSALQKAALISAKKAIANSKMLAECRTEVYRLKGTYCWLVNQHKKALQWWSKSIIEGKRLGARPELSRTYVEVGKRMSEAKSKYNQLNGIRAKEYLNTAGSMFSEMKLQRDLDELDRISVAH